MSQQQLLQQQPFQHQQQPQPRPLVPVQAASLASVAQQRGSSSNQQQQQQLPLAYRSRGLVDQPQVAAATTSTLTPQALSTIDYVNVNARLASAWPQQAWQASSAQTTGANPGDLLRPGRQTARQANNWQQAKLANNLQQQQQQASRSNAIKLVCDIDQVFPVPDVAIYRMAKAEGSFADKLAKLDTRIERNQTTGLFRVQVTSVVEDAELAQRMRLLGSHPEEPVYFECLIGLGNLELGKYADNKRSIVYWPSKSSFKMLACFLAMHTN